MKLEFQINNRLFFSMGTLHETVKFCCLNLKSVWQLQKGLTLFPFAFSSCLWQGLRSPSQLGSVSSPSHYWIFPISRITLFSPLSQELPSEPKEEWPESWSSWLAFNLTTPACFLSLPVFWWWREGNSEKGGKGHFPNTQEKPGSWNDDEVLHHSLPVLAVSRLPHL